MASLSGLRTGRYDELYVMQNGQLVDVATMSGGGGSTGPTGAAGSNGAPGAPGAPGAAGAPGAPGATGPTGAGGGGSALTAAEQTWLNSGQANLLQASTGLNTLRFENSGAIQGKNSAGAYEGCLYPRVANTTVLQYGSDGLNIQNSAGTTAMDVNDNLTCDLRNDLRLFAASPEIWMAGTGPTDEPTIYFRTPVSGNTGMKSAIRAVGTNSSGRSQLCFLLSNDAAASVHALNSDCAMLVDHQAVAINLPLGNTPAEALDIRDGNIGFSRVIPTTTATGLDWSGLAQPNNFPSSGTYTFARIEAYPMWQGGNIRFFTKPYNSTTLSQRMIVAENGNVGIATGNNPTSTLQVGGSFAASTKAFDIADEGKGGRWRLRHSCVESDDGGSTAYRRQLDCVQGHNFLELPPWFEWLCEETMCFTSPVKHFGNSYAEVVGRTVKVTTTKAGKYNILIWSKRKDMCAKECWKGVEYEAPLETENAE